MELKKIVSNLKNHIKALGTENVMELISTDDTVVVFEAADLDSIVEGIAAEPDGEFLFADGMKAVIKGGKVESIEKPTIEEEIVEEEVSEDAEIVKDEEEAPVEEPAKEEEPKTDEKDEKIAELEAKIEELTNALKEKTDEMEEVEKDLAEIKNFYDSVRQPEATREESIVKEEKKSFKFTGRK